MTRRCLFFKKRLDTKFGAKQHLPHFFTQNFVICVSLRNIFRQFQAELGMSSLYFFFLFSFILEFYSLLIVLVLVYRPSVIHNC